MRKSDPLIVEAMRADRRLTSLSNARYYGDGKSLSTFPVINSPSEIMQKGVRALRDHSFSIDFVLWKYTDLPQNSWGDYYRGNNRPEVREWISQSIEFHKLFMKGETPHWRNFILLEKGGSE